MGRYEWLAGMVNDHGLKRGAEIGVFYGRTFEYLLKNTQAFVHAVDVWDPSFREGKNSGEKCYCQYCQEMRSDRASMDVEAMEARVRDISDALGRSAIWKAPSVEAAAQFRDGWLDFVFIDGDHSYEGVRADVLAWEPKVRPGGLIAGHDWEMRSVREGAESVLGDIEQAGHDHVWFTWKK